MWPALRLLLMTLAMGAAGGAPGGVEAGLPLSEALRLAGRANAGGEAWAEWARDSLGPLVDEAASLEARLARCERDGAATSAQGDDAGAVAEARGSDPDTTGLWLWRAGVAVIVVSATCLVQPHDKHSRRRQQAQRDQPHAAGPDDPALGASLGSWAAEQEQAWHCQQPAALEAEDAADAAGDGEGGEQSLERELVEAQAKVTELRLALGLSGASVT